VLVLIGSYVFYGTWDWRFLALILVSTSSDYLCALAIGGHRLSGRKVFAIALFPAVWWLICTAARLEPDGYSRSAAITILSFPPLFGLAYRLLWQLPEPSRRRGFLCLNLTIGLGLLGFFKYFNFFAESMEAFLKSLGYNPGWTLPAIILPVGISFYTFQSISYVVDTYRRVTTPTRDLLTFATFISFFPQLVAGPIERSSQLMPQLAQLPRWDPTHLQRGARLILVGLFKKVFVADNCALLANHAFDPATTLNAWWAILGVLGFAFQIYGDFSGYTDIARGSARLLGIELNRNFRFPYLARDPSDFWRRWHITLSLWFRDYVYIPLGGNRCAPAIVVRNIWITMLLAGLWHGASWTFVLWGAYHAALLSIFHAFAPLRRMAEWQGLRSAAAVSLMFVLSLVGWAIFRSREMDELFRWFNALGHWQTAGALDWIRPCYWLLFHVVPLLLLQWATHRSEDEAGTDAWPWPVRGAAYVLIFLLFASSNGGNQEFIYFQF
jgi:D-alanyl-lipoteichoic acid acyltransferase DltB (MBOAT superfamily)